MSVGLVDNLLDIEHLYCEREGRKLFVDLNLSITQGQCVALTGPNGSGKSTLLRCICGLFPDYEGQICAGSIEYLGHRPGISMTLSPLENLRWYKSLVPETRAAGATDLPALLERVGLYGYEEVLCQQLSAGQQRRVALARLVLGTGSLWLLDEPFTALDAGGQDLVRSLLGEHLAGGGAALCATHQPLGVPGSIDLQLGQPR